MSPSEKAFAPLGGASPEDSLQHRRAGITILMVAFSLMSYFDRTIMPIAGPLIMRQFSLSETQMGIVYSAFTFSYALMMIPGGRWADRFGPRLTLTAMAAGATLFTGLTALGGKPVFGIWLGVLPSFLAIRLALGVLSAPLYPACAIINANWNPSSQWARVWGFVASGAGMGGALSPILFSWLIGRYGWRFAFIIAATVTGLLGFVWYAYVRDYPRPVSASQKAFTRDPAPWLRLFRNRHLMLLTVSYAAAAYFEYIFFYWIYYYFGNVRHSGNQRSAVYTTLIWISWTLMTPAGGWISDRLVRRYGLKLGRRLVPMTGLTLSAILLYIATNLTNEIAMVTLLFLALGSAAATDGPYWVSSSRIGGKHVGAAGGILNTGGNIGGFLAPILTPWIASQAGWSWSLYAGSLIALGGVLLWFFIDVTQTIDSAGSAHA